METAMATHRLPKKKALRIGLMGSRFSLKKDSTRR
jgi:hypothetical protein